VNFHLKNFWLLPFIILLHSCDIDSGQSDPNADLVLDKDGKIIEGEYTKFFDDGKVAAIMSFKDRKLEGKAVKFFKDGKTKRSELHYSAGKLEGVQKRFYESGAVYKEEMYHGDKRNGLTRKYREGGKIMSEATFKNGFPGTDLKEYLTDGRLKKKYPKIVVEVDDQIAINGSYKLKIFLSDKSQKVEFYLGKLDEGMYLSDNLQKQYNTVDGVLAFTFFLRPGGFEMHEYDIVAKVITRLNNVYITTRKHTLGIEYPLY
jgi:MORN repeat variant